MPSHIRLVKFYGVVAEPSSMYISCAPVEMYKRHCKETWKQQLCQDRVALVTRGIKLRYKYLRLFVATLPPVKVCITNTLRLTRPDLCTICLELCEL